MSTHEPLLPCPFCGGEALLNRDRRDLIRAAALIVAEIERLDRAAPTEGRDE